MNIICTGAAGSGGSYLCEYIAENHPDVSIHALVRWHSTTNIDNLKSIKNKITLHECDLLDLSQIIRILRKIKPDKIFNMASHANVRVCFNTPLAVLQNNIMSTANLLEAVRLECPETIFQQCSTSEVYGTPVYTPISENHPINPINPYAVSKLTQESLAYAYHKSWGLKCIITRMFAYINPRRHDLFATAFARQIVNIEEGNQDVLLHGNLESIRTLIDVRDAMKTYWIACDKCEYGVPYNIGGMDTLSVGEFLARLMDHTHVSIETKQSADLLRPVDVTRQIPDTSRFDSLTGWKPKYTLNDSIEFLLEHCRKEIV